MTKQRKITEMQRLKSGGNKLTRLLLPDFNFPFFLRQCRSLKCCLCLNYKIYTELQKLFDLELVATPSSEEQLAAADAICPSVQFVAEKCLEQCLSPFLFLLR